MSKEEVLNNDYVENEVIQPKNTKKIKIAIALVASLTIIASAILLVGYFKFNWFKSEIYNIDAKISRNAYQANYFSETKTINTRIGFTSGITQDNEQKIYTNFMVMQKDRKELKNNDFLNTATLVILDTKLENKNELKEINSFNIYHEENIKEFESNPDGAKYPMAVFSFYENGTIADILLPNNMDNYNAQTIIELIESVVPKLTRNRTEDISNGLEINTLKRNKKKVFVESISPREIPDFKGSRFVKSIEREIDNEQLTKIKTQANLELKTELEENENSFGLKDFKYETKSEIVSTGLKEEKGTAELINKFIEHYTLIKSQDLLEYLAKNKKDQIIGRYEITEEQIKSDNNLRNLISFDNFNGDATILVTTFNVLNCDIKIQIRYGAKNGEAFGEIIFTANQGKVSFGSNGITASTTIKTWKGEVPVFTFDFPPMPIIGLSLIAGGSVKIQGSISSEKEQLELSITGSLYAKVEIKAGWDKVASVAAGAKGTIISSSFKGAINLSGDLSTSGSLSAGDITIYVNGKTLGLEVFSYEWKVFDGWSKKF
jgi:hypothetical protein